MDERILNWLSTLQALAESPSFDNGDFAALYEQAVAVAEQQSGDIVVFDESIAQVLNTRRPYGEPLPVPAYPEPVRRTFATGEPQLAGPFLGAVAKTWLLSLDVPVKRNGRTLWSLNLSFTPEQLSILDQEQVSGGRTVLVINDNGVFAGSSEPKSDLVGEPIPGWLMRSRMARRELWKGLWSAEVRRRSSPSTG